MKNGLQPIAKSILITLEWKTAASAADGEFMKKFSVREKMEKSKMKKWKIS